MISYCPDPTQKRPLVSILGLVSSSRLYVTRVSGLLHDLEPTNLFVTFYRIKRLLILIGNVGANYVSVFKSSRCFRLSCSVGRSVGGGGTRRGSRHSAPSRPCPVSSCIDVACSVNMHFGVSAGIIKRHCFIRFCVFVLLSQLPNKTGTFMNSRQ